MPLRRTAPKGAADPGWREIGWDEAMAEIAGRLDALRTESGPESVAFAITSQSSSPISDSTDWLQRFVRLFGSPNNCFAVELCNWHKDYGHAFTFGCGLPTPDYRASDLIVLWGHDPANSWLAQAQAIGDAQARGARLVVIDPHRSGSAAGADIWCPVRPGTDGALALGIARLLVERASFDRAFVAAWTNGPLLVRADTGRFLRGADLGWADGGCYVAVDARSGALAPAGEVAAPDLEASLAVETQSGPRACSTAFALYRAALAPFTPDRVAAETGISAPQVLALADAFAGAKAVSYYGWTGIGQHTNATQTDRAIATLHALTGCFDAPGGNVLFAKHPARGINPPSLLSATQRAKALGIDARPLGPARNGWVTARDLSRAILEGAPYRVRALVGFGSNILVAHPEPARARAALEALDFQVHCDLFLNPTAELADIVLPVASAWERESLRVGFEITQEAEELVQLRQPMVAPLGACRSDLQIVFDLAGRLGLGDHFFGGSIEAGWNHVLEPLGLTVAQLRQRPAGIRLPLEWRPRKYEQAGFATETGRIELYSELLLRHGYHPLPGFVPPAEAPSARFPLVLTTGNRGNYCHAQHRDIVALRRRAPEPEASLDPQTAQARGITGGDWVRLTSRVGAARFKARIDPSVQPGTVVADYGWWQACPDLGLPGSVAGDPEGFNYNNLISGAAGDPLSGAPGLRSFACEVERGGEGAWIGRRAFRVAARREECAGVVTLRLEPCDGGALPGFRPGQHITLHRQGVSRSYSLSCAAVPAPSFYEVTVRRLDGGRFSPWATALAVGDAVECQAPGGLFALPLRNEFPVVLLAAGVGITPFIAYLRTLVGAAGEPQVILHYGSRDGAAEAFAAELARHAERLANLTVLRHLSRPGPHDRADVVGRITDAAIDDRLIAARARFYLCGPDAMMRSVTDGLLARGVPRFEIFQERFWSGPATGTVPAGTHRVVFARSGRSMDWTPEKGTILACAEAGGLDLPNGCRVGQCESCAVGIVSGGVAHLSEIAGLDDGLCFTCRAVPTSDLTLDA
ncbi:molybdopterin-dependent oxidoreductase [Xanthobacter sp. KR7-225]|uniref:molybdopterin-dependent oxidoreductase n=1 Tax=Xanthobacter sp. KR7-225 TaxID=3156613 RepID=UPI0032B62853